jgi:hypothetical protein
MQGYQPDSPSRMCDGSLDEAARMMDRSWVSLQLEVSIAYAYAYTRLLRIDIPARGYTSTPFRASCGARA